MKAILVTFLMFVFAASASAQGAGAVAALHTEATAVTDAAPAAPVAESTADAAVAVDVPPPEGTTNTSTGDAGATQVGDAEGDGGTEPEPTVGDIVKGAGDTFDIWKTQGWIAGLTALIYLLIQITKLGFIKTLLGVRKWLRPLIALVLGLAGSVFAAMNGGVVWWSALLGGIGAALGSSGFNELMNTVTPTGRAKRTGTG